MHSHPEEAGQRSAATSPASAQFSISFFRLFGDFDGNGTINNADFFQFNKTFARKPGDLRYLALFDYFGGGTSTINNADFFQFNEDFGKRP